MTHRFALWWWPIFFIASPILVPFLVVRTIIFKFRQSKAKRLNQERIGRARQIELPVLEKFMVTPLVEWEHNAGFQGAPGVSYLFQTDRGTMLFDIGFGPEDGVLSYNSQKLSISWKQLNALYISHLHMDHMGGNRASRSKMIVVPGDLNNLDGIPCFLPGKADAPGFTPVQVSSPGPVAAGLVTSGPLARSLFMMGWCEEQFLIGRLKGKGLVVFTGCGHPGIEVILQMVRRLSGEPVYAIGGGLHLPITSSRLKKPGLEALMIFGTGNPPWRRLTEDDLLRSINAIKQVKPKYVLLSAHDTCDFAIRRMKDELDAEVQVLKAGKEYQL